MGEPVYLKQLDSMRAHLTISALDRVRLLVEGGERKLGIRMECIACEELLEWDDSQKWWVCPGCQHETTEQEAVELFRFCYEALGAALGETDEGEEKGRWLDRIRALTGL